jgi:AAA15 family ATPase/GTPase
MFVRKLILYNFVSFCGKHVLWLHKGLNFVVGPSGSGKSNVVRAIRFAVLGHADFPRNRLVNSEYRRDCLKKGENPFCQVEVKMKHKNRGYVARSRLSLIGDNKIKQNATVDSVVDNMFAHKIFSHVFLNPMNLDEGKGNNSAATRIAQSALKHLSLNVKADINMAILDSIFEYFPRAYANEFLSNIRVLAMEQYIILGNWIPQNQEYPFKIIPIEFDRETFSSKLAK